LVNLATLISFWKRKETPAAPAPQPLISIPGLGLETLRSTSQEAANRAREELKILRLERQILGSALTTIYESQTKGLINQTERDQLLEKYKVDLKRLEKSIDEKQRVVDLYELESTREELVKNFKAKIAEIDAQVKGLKSGSPAPSKTAAQPKETKSDQGSEEKKGKPSEEGEAKERSGQKQPAKEKKAAEEEEQQISNAEKRVEQIREEILKAMDRLEQIEAEG
jgi:hypothetical protein